MARKTSGAATFIVFVIATGLVLGGLILASPPKTIAPDSPDQEPSEINADPSIVANNNRQVIGPEDAKVRIVVFSDYRCPYCRQLNEKLVEIQKENPEAVAVVFRNFTLGEENKMFAQAAYAAHLQGKLSEASELLYSKYQAPEKDEMIKMAEELGLDVNKFKSDLESEETASFVETDSADARQLGLRGTPSVFVNGQYLEDPGQISEVVSGLLEQ